MQKDLSWPQAKTLADTGSVVRRAGWLSSSIFSTDGGLYWLNAHDGSQRVITAADFQRGEFLALDWTDSAANQGHCIGIDLTAEMVAFPAIIITSEVSTITLTLSLSLDTDLVFNLTSSSSLLTVPSSITIPARQTSVTFSATAGAIAASTMETITAQSNLCTCVVNIGLQYVDVPPPPPPPPRTLTFSGNRHDPKADPYNLNPLRDNFQFTNPWSAPCHVTISGTMGGLHYLRTQIGKSVSGTYRLPVSFILPAGATDMAQVTGTPNDLVYNLTVVMSL